VHELGWYTEKVKLFFFFVLLIGGIVAVIYPFWIVKTFGHMRWSEEKLGAGSSYATWRMIGVLMIFASYLLIRFF
jgi:hypothetical protein